LEHSRWQGFTKTQIKKKPERKLTKEKRTTINTIQEENDQNFEDILDKAKWLAQKTWRRYDMLKPHKPEAMKEHGLHNMHIKRRITKKLLWWHTFLEENGPQYQQREKIERYIFSQKLAWLSKRLCGIFKYQKLIWWKHNTWMRSQKNRRRQISFNKHSKQRDERHPQNIEFKRERN